MSLGELQLSDYGISGVPVFQISRYASMHLQQADCVYAKVDFLPEYSLENLCNIKNEYKAIPNNTILDYLNAYFLEPLTNLILARCNISGAVRFGDVTKEQWNHIVYIAKNWKMRIVKTADFDRAQVAAGGVSTKEVASNTMESKLVKGLYFAGELLDIDGTCGGYNIQFAISTAQIAAQAIADVV